MGPNTKLEVRIIYRENMVECLSQPMVVDIPHRRYGVGIAPHKIENTRYCRATRGRATHT